MFRSFKGWVMDTGCETLSKPSVRKRRCITKGSKAFKKKFDPSPSTLFNCSPLSQKCTLFKLMVSDWWLQSHLDTKTLAGAAWLEGFYDCLKEDDFYMVDRDYLKKLVVWHKERENVEWPVDDTLRHMWSLCQTRDVQKGLYMYCSA